MKDYLVFRLYGALASWGDIAVGDIRPSYRQPSKSAVIGLIAAALGVKRDEDVKQAELFKLLFSVRVDVSGTPIEDYHTVQTPYEGTIKNNRVSTTGWTRLDEIEAIKWRVKHDNSDEAHKQAGAIQSCRTYNCDALYTVAISENSCDSISWHILNLESLHDFVKALQTPKFNLYLGRKSCPLALPLEPQVKWAENFKEALDKTEFYFEKEVEKLIKSKIASQKHYYSEEQSSNSQMKISRRDQPVNKQTWQFATRDEYVLLATGENHVSESR
jgi:CRISPR system Cascade subunit CasD